VKSEFKTHVKLVIELVILRYFTFQSATLTLIAENRDFANRFHMIAGDSNETVPIFVKKIQN
jgi:hypothetical protein